MNQAASDKWISVLSRAECAAFRTLTEKLGMTIQ